jgi:hypothetical protein
MVRWSEAELELHLARKKGRPAPTPTKAKAEANRAKERGGQAELARQLALLGLPEPTWEHVFAPPRRWRFDGAYVDAKVAFEIDGGVWSGGRHNRGSGYVKDMEKLNTAAVNGWRVLRFTYEMVEDGTAARLILACYSIAIRES